MKCPKCHEKISITDNTCPYCGFNISSSKPDEILNTIHSSADVVQDKIEKNDNSFFNSMNQTNSSDKPWVEKYNQQLNATRKVSTIALVVILFFIGLMFTAIIVSTSQIVIFIPFLIFVSFIIFAISLMLKSTKMVRRDYGSNIILVFNDGKAVNVVIDDVLVKREVVSSMYNRVIDCFIPGSKIQVRVQFTGLTNCKILVGDEIDHN